MLQLVYYRIHISFFVLLFNDIFILKLK